MIKENCIQEFIEERFISVLELQKKFLLGWNLFNQNKIKRAPQLNKRVFSLGSAHLLNYNEQEEQEDKGEIILIIPSLINRYYILDLSEEDSLIQYLHSLNYRVFVIEWEEPIQEEYSFNLEDYVIKRIIPMLNFIQQTTQNKVLLLGYCLGGTLAVMTSFMAKIRGLILVATPWNFAKIPYFANIDDYNYNFPLISGEEIKRFFWSIDYERVLNKFVNFYSLKKDSKKYEKFLKVESWVDNGISVTKKMLKDLCILNRKGLLQFENNQIGEEKINNEVYNSLPKLIIISLKDKLIPLVASLPLISSSNSSVLTIDSGHVGMFINDKAKSKLYSSIGAWGSNLKD